MTATLALPARLPPGLALLNACATGHGTAQRDIGDPQADQVTGAQLAVDGEVEQRPFAGPVLQLRLHPDGPDFWPLERRLLAAESAFVPWHTRRVGFLGLHLQFLEVVG
jgi:hypothetical protein